MATLETIPLLFVFLVLLGYAFGFYGVIQTGILQSIAARNYAFETFRHRANLNYHRENVPDMLEMASAGTRLHRIISERSPDADAAYATERPISRFLANASNSSGTAAANANIHNVEVYKIQEGRRNQTVSVSPVWVKSQYGICLNANCGDGSVP